MLRNLAAILFATAMVAAILPPGYGAYIGSYIVMAVSLVGFALYAWPQRQIFLMPPAMAILVAIALVSLTLPFVYRGPQDLMAPVLLLPMLSAIGLAILGTSARWIPNGTQVAALCLSAAAIALLGGVYEQYVLGAYRVGLGNNPIHYGTIAAILGNLALIGIISGRSPMRYVFFLGPLFGLGAAFISGSRGPMLGSLIMTAVSLPFLSLWLWKEVWFRVAAMIFIVAGALAFVIFMGSANGRAFLLFEGATNIFRFTGGHDDIRAGLYISSLHAGAASPVFGHGLGQLMDTARLMFPQLPEVHHLENLHADWANFLVMAGGLGVLAYFLLLFSPLLLLVDQKGRSDRFLVLAVIMLSTGQLVMGLSNAMFGVLPQTILFATFLGYLMAYRQRAAYRAPAQGTKQER